MGCTTNGHMPKGIRLTSSSFPLSSSGAAEANDYVRVPIATGLGVVRNLVVVTSADAVVAIGGRHGTLSEIGLALRMGRHVVTLSSWRLESDQRIGGPRVHRAKDPREAAALALRLAREGPLDHG